MRQLRYLNVILTVNALLLAGLVWTQLMNGPAWSSTAAAQVGTRDVIPNASEQRVQMIRLLREINRSTADIKKRLDDQEVKVRVVNAAEMRQEGSSNGSGNEERDR